MLALLPMVDGHSRITTLLFCRTTFLRCQITLIFRFLQRFFWLPTDHVDGIGIGMGGIPRGKKGEW